MRFRRVAPATLIVSIGIVVIASAAASQRLFGGMTETVERSQFELMENIISFNMRGAEQKALARAEMLADLPRVKTLLAAKDRPGLLAELGGLFQTQKEKYGVEQVQFVTPPTTSLVRLQAPEVHGDDLSTFRPLIVAVNQDRSARSGASISRTGPGLFGVVPVTDAGGAYIGIVEVAMGIGPVLDGLKSAYGLESALFIEDAPLREIATSAPKETFDKQNQVGRYLKTHATNWGVMRELVDASDLARVDQAVHYVRDSDGRAYGVILIALKSASGASLGVIAIAKDFSQSREATGRSVIWQGLIAVLGILLLAGVVVIVIRGFLLAPLAELNGHLGAIARGEPGTPVEDADEYCEELRTLAEHHEAIRARVAPPAGDDGDGDAEKDA